MEAPCLDLRVRPALLHRALFPARPVVEEPRVLVPRLVPRLVLRVRERPVVDVVRAFWLELPALERERSVLVANVRPIVASVALLVVANRP